jgi:hypothetical protein
MGLDLSRIEAWSREMLEGEARRRGIRSPEFRTRGELIRLILRHQYGDRFNAGRDRIAQARTSLKQARELLGATLGAALTALPEPLETLMRLRGRLPPPQRPRPPARQETPAPSTRAPVPAQEPQPEVSAPAAAPAVTPVAAVPTAVPEIAAPAADFSPPPPPEAAEPRRPMPATRTFVEEPIRTRSMARLLAAQGHKERALAIYAELIESQSDTDALRAEAETVRRGDPIDAPLLPAPGAEERLSAPPESGDKLWSEGEPGSGLLLRWSITDGGLQRARAVLGKDGEIAVRVISIRPDEARVVRSEITEHAPVDASGEWQTPPLPSSVRCFAAAGLRHGDRFVAIVHVHPGAKRKSTPSVRPSVPA